MGTAHYILSAGKAVVSDRAMGTKKVLFSSFLSNRDSKLNTSCKTSESLTILKSRLFTKFLRDKIIDHF